MAMKRNDNEIMTFLMAIERNDNGIKTSPMTMKQTDNEIMASSMTTKQNDNKTKWQWNNDISNEIGFMTKKQSDNDNGNDNEI